METLSVHTSIRYKEKIYKPAHQGLERYVTRRTGIRPEDFGFDVLKTMWLQETENGQPRSGNYVIDMIKKKVPAEMRLTACRPTKPPSKDHGDTIYMDIDIVRDYAYPDKIRDYQSSILRAIAEDFRKSDEFIGTATYTPAVILASGIVLAWNMWKHRGIVRGVERTAWIPERRKAA